MNNIIFTDSVDIPELDLYVSNKEIHLLRYFEPEPGLFIAESRNVISIGLDAGYKPLSIVVFASMLSDPILDRFGDAPIYVVDKAAAQKHFGYMLPGGILCAMRRKPLPAYTDILKGTNRIVVLEDVENPTNVGAVFRSAAAFGIDAILLSPACVDPLYRRAMRVSVGNTFRIPWTFICRNETDWQTNGLQLLKDEGFTTVAMALRKDNVDIDSPVLKSCGKLALIMGNEGCGLSDSTINSCDYVAKIPMQNDVDSLNVAVAAGIAMWELRKQCIPYTADQPAN